MKKHLPLSLLISCFISLIAMESGLQSTESHTTPCSHIGNYWGSIRAIELWIHELIRHMPAPAPELYHIHTERIIDDWLFAHPCVLTMTFTEAASRCPDVFTKLPEKPKPELHARYLHQILEDIFQRRLTEYHKYEHDVQRGSKAHPAGKYR